MLLPLLLVVAGALATARLTRLITADQLTEPARRRMIQAVKEGGQLEYLLSCRWCASVHVGFLVAAIVVGTSPQLHPDTTTTLVLVGLLTLAYSQFTGERAAAEVEV